MATKFSKCVWMCVAGAALAFGAIGFGSSASAESPDGWRATGAEAKVFQANRDDGRTVGIYARPAVKLKVKDLNSGMLVRVTLTGFKDKSLALQEADLPELYKTYGKESRGWNWRKPFHGIGKWFREAVEKIVKKIEKKLEKYLEKGAREIVAWVLKEIGIVEAGAALLATDGLEGDAAVQFLNVRADAVVAASRLGGDLTQRFSRANGQTIQNLPGASRGVVVRAIHSALLSAGAQ